jgi:hypothetical protein
MANIVQMFVKIDIWGRWAKYCDDFWGYDFRNG